MTLRQNIPLYWVIVQLYSDFSLQTEKLPFREGLQTGCFHPPPVPALLSSARWTHDPGYCKTLLLKYSFPNWAIRVTLHKYFMFSVLCHYFLPASNHRGKEFTFPCQIPSSCLPEQVIHFSSLLRVKWIKLLLLFESCEKIICTVQNSNVCNKL